MIDIFFLKIFNKKGMANLFILDIFSIHSDKNINRRY